LQSITYREQEA